ILRGLAPVVRDPLVEYMRARLALDEFKGARAHDLLAVEILASGVPARLALDHQVGVGGDGLDELWCHLCEVEDDRVVVDDFYSLRHFLRHVRDSSRLRYPHQSTPGTRVTLDRFRLSDQEDRVAHVPGAELTPVLVEFDALA